MRSATILGVLVIALSLGSAAIAEQHGGREWDRDDHSNGREQRHAQARHVQHEEVRHVQHEEVRRGPEHNFHGAHGPAQAPEVRRPQPQMRYAKQDIWQRQRARDWDHEHRSWRERGGYRGYRIPQARFHERFGRGHWFHVHDVPVMVVEGAPRFQFGGFWFTMVDPCPQTWSPAWYRTDEVYIDYVQDGYYMFNRRHPGVAIAINVSM